jgi:O-acetyl-ADP-ribose deacetylase
MNKIEIIHADITTLKVDAIVNAANNSLMGGGCVDGAIHKAAGNELKESCRALNGCQTGMSKMTLGFNLPAAYIIHTVGPAWNNDTQNESELLKSCYKTALQLACEHQLKTIAFPSISTGAYRFPFDKASKIAFETITTFLKTNPFPQKVIIALFSEKDVEQFKRVIK